MNPLEIYSYSVFLERQLYAISREVTAHKPVRGSRGSVVQGTPDSFLLQEMLRFACLMRFTISSNNINT
jgi:hypothetical protein